jgi:hypothetical protein
MALFYHLILIGLELSLSAGDVAKLPSNPPRADAAPQELALEGVAMRFRDEGTFVSGVTYTR